MNLSKEEILELKIKEKYKVNNLPYKILFIKTSKIIYVQSKYEIHIVQKSNLTNKKVTIQTALDKVNYCNNKLDSKFKNKGYQVLEYKKESEVIFKDSEKQLFKTTFSSLYRGAKSFGKNAIDKTKYFLYQMNKAHNNKYEYPNFNYDKYHGKIKISCPKHGNFFQIISNHIKGHGCKICQYNQLSRYWCRDCEVKNKKGKFYILKCSNKKETFMKLGITYQDKIYNRYNNKYHMPYNFELLTFIIGDCREIFKLEKYAKKFIKNNNMHYVPKINFGGSIHECYKIKKH